MPLEIDLDSAPAPIDKDAVLWSLRNEQLPTFDVLDFAPLILNSSEICHGGVLAGLLELKSKNKRLKPPSANSLRLRMMADLESVDFGLLYITNQRSVFVGRTEHRAVRHSQVLSVTESLDGFAINISRGKCPHFYLPDKIGNGVNDVGVWFYPALLAEIILRSRP